MMENNEEFKESSFLRLLEECSVEIPIIQRNYAQGRTRKEKIRNDFLDALKDALTNKPVELDFIYGDKENEVFRPLDGQQRLTTLFLLHWYIANREGKSNEAKERLAKFTYETRVSSREFCRELVLKSVACQAEKQISACIRNASWFVESWRNDPTISAMLTMLDAIHAKFKDTSDIWEKLTSEHPITFIYIRLKDIGLSDDLYVKMNARGKQLTSFESFKANLVGHLKELDKNDDPRETIAHKLDTTWTDIFWKNQQDGKIDEIYFAFLNRYFLNVLTTTTKDEKGNMLPTNKIEKNKLFKILFGTLLKTPTVIPT